MREQVDVRQDVQTVGGQVGGCKDVQTGGGQEGGCKDVQTGGGKVGGCKGRGEWWVGALGGVHNGLVGVHGEDY